MNKILFLSIAVLVIIGAFLLIDNKRQQMIPVATKQTSVATQPKQIGTPESQLRVSLNVTASGFDPQTITVKTGTQVVWRNISGRTVTVDSDLHPTHRLYPPLNLGPFENGSSVRLVFDKPGMYKYHNNLDSSQTGGVVVQ